MDWRKRKRQIFLFLVAILLPASVLVGLALRLFREDAELANKRLVEAERASLEQTRREIAARLEAIKLRTEVTPMGAKDSAVVIAMPIDGEKPILPWEGRAAPTDRNPVFNILMRHGEMAEFPRFKCPIVGCPALVLAAVQLYRRAGVAASGRPAEDCEARLALARVLLKSGKKQEAKLLYLSQLKECGEAADEDGIPYRFYAAERLIHADLDPQAGLDYAIQEASSETWRPQLPLYLLRTLLQSESSPRAANAAKRVDEKIQESEKLAALAKDFPRVLARLEPAPGQPSHDSVWLPYATAPDDNPWLLTVVSGNPRPAPFALIVSSDKVAPPGVKLVTDAAPSSEPVGEEFPGLRFVLRNSRPIETRGFSATLSLAGLALIVGVTLLGGYFLIRDVNREVKTAELRSHFVASVSHELKTPLTAIRMFAETLALGRSSDAETTSEYLRTIMNESERLTQLVDNVLDFSKIERGAKIYRMRPTMLADVVLSAVRAMRYQLEQQGFALNLSIDESVPSVSADPDAMEQAILNLLTNAMKYSGESRRIELAVRSNRKEATIEVTDWGLGIPSTEQARIFEKFYRISYPNREPIAGAGLGLTLVAHIAQAHGGAVAVRSVPGQGSTFSITLPIETSGAAT